ncbi:MAG: ECF transporter S component [Clostridiales bacterium]|nr:ECF transporter S component [Clostridiales bacterium]
MKRSLSWLTRTAILLALTVLFQSLRVIMPFMPANISQYVVGSLVNLCLIVAAVTLGIKGGAVIAIVAPIIAFLQGFTPFAMLVIPIALGNLVLVVAVALLYKKSMILAFVTGAIAKLVALYIGVVLIVLPFFLPNAPAQLQLAFSWPQLVTASIGGVLAALVLPILKKAVKY